MTELAQSRVTPSGTRIEIRVEDDRTGMDPVTLKRAVLDHLCFTRSKTLSSATKLDLYFALAHTVRDRLVHRWMHTRRTYQEKDPKRIYYLSAEYLLGRMLYHNLLNLGLYDIAKEGMAGYGLDLADILEEETDPGLGNGGLGRLAACFLDSMATMALPGYGYGIRYEFGIFRQEFKDGWQVEQPDEWLRYGNPWEVPRHEYTVPVNFFGRVEEYVDGEGVTRTRWVGTTRVMGVPYDMPVAGYGNDTVNTLRLWAARASEEFDLQVFNDGDYRRAVEQKAISESISKVLYPKDNTPTGKELRLKQQYFFVCCSIRDIVRRFKKSHSSFDRFAEKVAVQLNDTHPSIAVAELMRVLIDEEKLEWERAWQITTATCAYTNHTLLPEALEQWPLEMFGKLLPRHLQIIFDINHRFLRQVHIYSPNDKELQRRMSIIGEDGDRTVRMAFLSVAGSHTVNGVAKLHSDLLKSRVLADYAALWPRKFTNMTNGVTPRRWLLQCNPQLSDVLTEHVGPGWVTDMDRLERLNTLANDPGLHAQLRAGKRARKVDLSNWMRRNWGFSADPDSIFDVQVKRIHEYKRQLMNCLHVIALYQKLKFNPSFDAPPRTVIFGGKAAPGYAQAKLHIKLINDVANIINNDPRTNERLKMFFWPNYDVSSAERIIPASDLSEQISLAGMEASGTGNMKFQMNGALTIGTFDGANIEIREAVGEDNFFLFGLRAEEVNAMKAKGYAPGPLLEQDDELRTAIELIRSGFFSPEDPSRYHGLIHYLTTVDTYLICADFDSYRKCHIEASRAYMDPAKWAKMVVHNIANSGRFSSDRTIREYARDIWGVSPVQIQLPEYTSTEMIER